jgi:hypothetical protein
MSDPSRFHFTIGQLMGVVALSAVLFAATSLSVAGQFMYLVAFDYAVALVGAGVLLYNVRLSPWMWVAFTGYAVPMLTGILVSFASAMMPSPLFSTVHFALNGVFSILFVLGLAMTFRDVRRSLAGRETDGAASVVRQGPLTNEAGPPEEEGEGDADDGSPEQTGGEEQEEE